MARDFYQVLGVDEKAGKDEIKKKYRELAKKYHPDRNHGDKQAEERFKEISEAYHVLSDDEKRQQYDTMRRFGAFDGGGFRGAGGQPGGGRFYTDADFSQVFGDRFNVDDLSGFGGLGDIFSSLFGENIRTRGRTPFGRQAGPQKRQNVHGEVRISPQQAANGVTKKIRFGIPEPCSACGGQGTVPGAGQTACPRCKGSGRITNVQGNFSITRPCPSCLGQGMTPGQKCQICGGAGSVKKKRTVAVKIPAGIKNDETIRLRGLGHPGHDGGPAGDLIMRVKVMSDQKYSREGSDIQTSVKITFPQAALGAKVPVQALTKKIMVTIKPGIQPGTVLRLKGLGLAVGDNKGDLLVTVNVTIPTGLTERQKEILREFEAATAA
jgi:molecular chaperone DnaJ